MAQNYDARDFATFRNTENFDEAQSAFLARQLTYIRGQVMQVKKATLNAFNVFPVQTDIPSGAETAIQRVYDSIGTAEIISNWGDDLPRVDILAQENAVSVKMVGDSYGFNIREVQNAAYAGLDLSAAKGRAAKYAIDAKLNQIAWYGDKAHHIIGFLDNPNISEYTLKNDGTGSSTALKDKTEEQVFRDLNGLLETIADATNQQEQANTLLLAPAAYTFLAEKRLGDTQTTYLNFFKSIHPELSSIRKVPELKGAGEGGKDLMVAGFFDPAYVKFEIPIRLDQRPAQYRNLEYIIPCIASTAGVTVIMPFAFAKAVGA